MAQLHFTLDLSLIHILVLFLVFRKKVMAGVARGGTKG